MSRIEETRVELQLRWTKLQTSALKAKAVAAQRAHAAWSWILKRVKGEIEW